MGVETTTSGDIAMTRLVNLKTYDGPKKNVVYIGRFMHGWGSSVFQNRNKEKDCGSKAVCKALYKKDLPNSPRLLAKLPELKAKIEQGKVLGCWCVPEPCHGEVLLEAMGLDVHITVTSGKMGNNEE